MRAFRVLKVSRLWKSTLWRVSFEDITSIRAFGILYWESQLVLEREEGSGHDSHAVSVMKGGDIFGHVPRE